VFSSAIVAVNAHAGVWMHKTIRVMVAKPLKQGEQDFPGSFFILIDKD
jgi:hypothetical protein